jgi:hypothetical protein
MRRVVALALLFVLALSSSRPSHAGSRQLNVHGLKKATISAPRNNGWVLVIEVQDEPSTVARAGRGSRCAGSPTAARRERLPPHREPARVAHDSSMSRGAPGRGPRESLGKTSRWSRPDGRPGGVTFNVALGYSGREEGR